MPVTPDTSPSCQTSRTGSPGDRARAPAAVRTIAPAATASRNHARSTSCTAFWPFGCLQAPRPPIARCAFAALPCLRSSTARAPDHRVVQADTGVHAPHARAREWRTIERCAPGAYPACRAGFASRGTAVARGTVPSRSRLAPTRDMSLGSRSSHPRLACADTPPRERERRERDGERSGADEERTGIRPPRGHREHRLAQHGMVRAVAVVLEEGEHRPDVAGTRRHVLHDDGQRRPPCGRYLGGSALRIRPEIRG